MVSCADWSTSVIKLEALDLGWDAPNIMRRVKSAPESETFKIPAVRELLTRWLAGCEIIVDPFARNSKYGTITNDLDPGTSAQFHLKAEEFCQLMVEKAVMANAVLFDPPYSPRQISEAYKGVGLAVTMQDTQNAVLYRNVRMLLNKLLRPGGIAVSFGWSSAGFGIDGYTLMEVLLCCHGAGRNDTIVVVEHKRP